MVKSGKLLANALSQAQERYQGDFLIVFSDVAVEAEAMGCRLEFPSDAPPHVVESADPDKIRRTDPHCDGRLPMMIEAANILVERFGRQVPVFASMKDSFSVTLACGVENFFSLLVTDHQKAHGVIEIAHENQQRYLEALVKTGAHIIIGAPLASGGLLGSKHFQEFALNSLQDLVGQAHEANRLVGIHSCGDANPILEDLAGISADFLSLESFNLTHWKTLASKATIPALMGYFPTGLLLTGTPEEIRWEARTELEDAAGLSAYPGNRLRCPSARSPRTGSTVHGSGQNFPLSFGIKFSKA